jgi:hypothetical protein
MKDSGPDFCPTCFLVIKPYSPKEKSTRAKSPTSRSIKVWKIGKNQHCIRKIFVATVMIKMRGVIEIKLEAAGGPAHNVDPYPGANRFLNLKSAQTGDFV